MVSGTVVSTVSTTPYRTYGSYMLEMQQAGARTAHMWDSVFQALQLGCMNIVCTCHMRRERQIPPGSFRIILYSSLVIALHKHPFKNVVRKIANCTSNNKRFQCMNFIARSCLPHKEGLKNVVFNLYSNYSVMPASAFTSL